MAPDKESGLSVVGKNWSRLDGVDKVSGRSIFADDVRVPGMLAGKIVRSPMPHARIVSIDTSRRRPARRQGGHHGGRYQGHTDRHQPAADCPRTSSLHVGHEVAAVAAINEEVAAEAAALIKVEYEPLPAIADIRKALAEDAPLLHAKAKGNVAGNRILFTAIRMPCSPSAIIFVKRNSSPIPRITATRNIMSVSPISARPASSQCGRRRRRRCCFSIASRPASAWINSDVRMLTLNYGWRLYRPDSDPAASFPGGGFVPQVGSTGAHSRQRR